MLVLFLGIVLATIALVSCSMDADMEHAPVVGATLDTPTPELDIESALGLTISTRDAIIQIAPVGAADFTLDVDTLEKSRSSPMLLGWRGIWSLNWALANPRML